MKVRNMIRKRKWTARRVALVLLGSSGLLAASLLPTGCRERQQISGRDLQTLKSQEVTKRQGTLTAEEEMQILSIQARSQEEFDQKVEGVLAHRQK